MLNIVNSLADLMLIAFMLRRESEWSECSESCVCDADMWWWIASRDSIIRRISEMKVKLLEGKKNWLKSFQCDCEI